MNMGSVKTIFKAFDRITEPIPVKEIWLENEHNISLYTLVLRSQGIDYTLCIRSALILEEGFVSLR